MSNVRFKKASILYKFELYVGEPGFESSETNFKAWLVNQWLPKTH